jgi:REP element-mobilizing transposase RayT
MSQSLARLHIHLVFSTKNRQRLITNAIRPSLHAYMGAVLKGMGCHPVLINSVEDHIHLLFELARTAPLSHVTEQVKTTSSKWMKSQAAHLSTFAWQSGYGAFAVSWSNVKRVQKYIAHQQTHHRTKSFEAEHHELLMRHQISYHEKHP